MKSGQTDWEWLVVVAGAGEAVSNPDWPITGKNTGKIANLRHCHSQELRLT
jgi:hypothetical protein